MSRQELVSAFLDGQISRRTLIRRLVAGGVSTGAAISYAHLLAPDRAEAGTVLVADDHYPLADMRIVNTSLAQLRTHSRIRVSVTSTEELQNAFFRAFVKTQAGGVPLGSRFLAAYLAGAGTREIAIPINTAPFATRTSARFYVQLQAQDAELYPTLASAVKTLS